MTISGTPEPNGTAITATLDERYRLTFTVYGPWLLPGQPAEVTGRRVRIGARLEDDVDLAINEESVSQPHGEFFLEGDFLAYRDLGSRYGSVLLDEMEELAFLHPVDRPTEYLFPRDFSGRTITYQAGQIGVWLHVERLG